jgi:nitrous oxidase accessory protein NosD
MRKRALLALLLLLSAVLFSTVLSATILSAKGSTKNWTVDDDGSADFHTIQEAIAVSNDGDIIEVKSGTYSGDLNITKSLSLRGQNVKSTIIHGCIFVRTSGVMIDSFTLLGFGRWEQLRTFKNGYAISTLSGIPHSMGSLQETWGTTISNCIFDNWVIPIALMSGDGERVINNTIRNSDGGIDIDTFNNVIAYNTISCGGNGITIGDEYVTGNLVSGNHIFGAERGIVINWFNHDNDIVGNTISNCQEGIHLGAVPEGYGPCSNNTIFHNNFINNNQQVFLSNGSSDTWDDGYPSGGNFWSDYIGTDANNDGIGDRPYVIAVDSVDRYPLMAQFTPVPTPTPTPTPVPTQTPTPTPNQTQTPAPDQTPSPTSVPESFFTVESNSTVSALAFNSTSSELSFTVSGPSNTTGYVKVTIAKSLVTNAENIKVYLDGNQLNYDVTSSADSWLLTFTYAHSKHNVMISLATNEAEEALLSNDLISIAVLIVLIAAVIGVGLQVYLKKRKH